MQIESEFLILEKMNGPQWTAVSRKELWQKTETRGISNHLIN